MPNADRSRATLEGLARAAKWGRKGGAPRRVSDDEIRNVIRLGTAEAARVVGLSRTQYIARRRLIEEAKQ